MSTFRTIFYWFMWSSSLFVCMPPFFNYYVLIFTHCFVWRECLSKSNTCPICGIQFYKKESQLNRLVKESISYVSDIIRLTSLTITNNEITDTNSLPDISLVITRPQSVYASQVDLKPDELFDENQNLLKK